MLKASLRDYSDANILVKGTITVARHVGEAAPVTAVTADRNKKNVIFKNCAPFTDCIRK